MLCKTNSMIMSPPFWYKVPIFSVSLKISRRSQMLSIKKAYCLWSDLPTQLRLVFCNRRERQGLILLWAKDKVSATRSITAALIWAFLPREKNFCVEYRDASSAQL